MCTACGSPADATIDESSSSSSGRSAETSSASSDGSGAAVDGSSEAPPADLGLPDDPSGDPPDGEPLPDAPAGEWQWIEIEGATCRDGSQAGFAYRHGTTDKLMIFFDEGGACFNPASCLITPGYLDTELPSQGLFADRSDNPIAEWHQAFMPYCTGDVHGGVQPDGGTATGTQGQRFVGWTNIGLYLARLHPTFPTAEHVFVTGSSAGGFGAGANALRIADRWPDAQITMIDDSGMPLADEWLAPCLQKRWRETWGIEQSFLADCDEPCNGDEQGGGIIAMVDHLEAALPDANLAFVSSMEDPTMRQFFGYGTDECAMLDVLMPPPLSGADYSAGLNDLRARLDGPRSGSFFFPGEYHIMLMSDSMYFYPIDGVFFVDWMSGVLDGAVEHLGP